MKPAAQQTCEPGTPAVRRRVPHQPAGEPAARPGDAHPLTTELLILPDGQILVHNLTQPFAELLRELNPGCEQIVSRTAHDASCPHELSD